MNYEFNLLSHVGVVAKIVCEAAAETAAETVAHEGDDNIPSGLTGRGVKTRRAYAYSMLSPAPHPRGYMSKSYIGV